jgi:acyl carrier protein
VTDATSHSPDQIGRWLRTNLAEVLDLPEDDVQLTSELGDDLDADSIDLTDVINRIERRYDVAIDDHEIADLRTVADLVGLVERAIARR